MDRISVMLSGGREVIVEFPVPVEDLDLGDEVLVRVVEVSERVTRKVDSL